MAITDEVNQRDDALDYVKGGSLGIIIVIGYLFVGIGATLYLLYLVSLLYQWIIDFGNSMGMFWGFLVAIISFLGIVAATGIGLYILFYIFNNYRIIFMKIKRIVLRIIRYSP